MGRVTSITSPLSAGEGQGEGSDTTAYLYDFGSDTDTLTTLQGATVAVASGSAVFNNLPQAPGLARTYVVYVQSSSAPANNGSGYTITENGTASLTLSFVGSATTPFGALRQRLVRTGHGHTGQRRFKFHADRRVFGLGHCLAGRLARVNVGRDLRCRRQPHQARSIRWGTRRVTPTMTWGCPTSNKSMVQSLVGPDLRQGGQRLHRHRPAGQRHRLPIQRPRSGGRDHAARPQSGQSQPT